MGYVKCETAKNLLQKIQKKLSLFAEVATFFIISFQNRFDWNWEILHFSHLFILRLLRLPKNLSGTDISQPGSRVLRRPGSSLGSID